MTRADFDAFIALRARVLAFIELHPAHDPEDGAHEGVFSLTLPGIGGGDYFIDLRCDAIGPDRYHEWAGRTFGEARAALVERLPIVVTLDVPKLEPKY